MSNRFKILDLGDMQSSQLLLPESLHSEVILTKVERHASQRYGFQHIKACSVLNVELGQKSMKFYFDEHSVAKDAASKISQALTQ